MLEIEDSKLGRIKFINVTECRTHISKIMTDTTCNYVITKNNYPIRVIINYDVFQAIQESEKAKTVKSSDSKALLKGLIEVTEKELKTQAAKRQRDKILEPELRELPVKPAELPPPIEAAPLTEELLGAPPAPPADEVEDELVPSPELPLAEASAAPAMTKEEADYFQRFKKLYDEPSFHRSSLPTSAAATGTPPPRDPPSIQDLLKDLDQERLSQEDGERPTDDLGELLKRLSRTK